MASPLNSILFFTSGQDFPCADRASEAQWIRGLAPQYIPWSCALRKERQPRKPRQPRAKQTKRKWKVGRTASGMIERGFSHGMRKVGERQEQPGPVKILMKDGQCVAPPSVCVKAIRQSNQNLSKKLERLGLTGPGFTQ